MNEPQTTRNHEESFTARLLSWIFVVTLLCGAAGLRADPATNAVPHAELLATMDQMKELLSGVAGLEIKTVGSKVVVDGKVKTPTDIEKIKRVLAAYPGAVIDL